MVWKREKEQATGGAVVRRPGWQRCVITKRCGQQVLHSRGCLGVELERCHREGG